MIEVKFECPSCKQHIQCDHRFVGENIPCPSCATLVRVPAFATHVETGVCEPPASAAPDPGENPFESADVKSEAISYSTKQTAEPAETAAAAAAPSPEENNPGELAPAAASQEPPSAQAAEFQCVCPVCHSQLSVRAEIAAAGGASNTAPVAAPAATGESERGKGQDGKKPGSGDVPVSLYPAMKPRLSFILTGEKPPPAAHDASPHAGQAGSDMRTLNE